MMGSRKTTKRISSLRAGFWFEPGTSLNREVHSYVGPNKHDPCFLVHSEILIGQLFW